MLLPLCGGREEKTAVTVTTSTTSAPQGVVAAYINKTWLLGRIEPTLQLPQ